MAKSSVLSRIGRGVGAAATSFGQSMQQKAMRDREIEQEDKRAAERIAAETADDLRENRRLDLQAARDAVAEQKQRNDEFHNNWLRKSTDDKATAQEKQHAATLALQSHLKGAELQHAALLAQKAHDHDITMSGIKSADAKALATHQNNLELKVTRDITNLQALQRARAAGFEVDLELLKGSMHFLALPMPDEKENPELYKQWKQQNDRFEDLIDNAKKYSSDQVKFGQVDTETGAVVSPEEAHRLGDEERKRLAELAAPELAPDEDTGIAGLDTEVYNAVRLMDYSRRGTFWLDQIEAGKMTTEEAANAEWEMFKDGNEEKDGKYIG